jgi:hypothetical protein
MSDLTGNYDLDHPGEEDSRGGELLFQAADGTMHDEAALAEFEESDFDGGRLYWSDQDDLTEVTFGDDGELVSVEDDPDDGGLSPEQQAHFMDLLEEHGDVHQAILAYSKSVDDPDPDEHDAPDEDDESELAEFLAENPHVLRDVDGFLPYWQQAGGDKEAALANYEAWLGQISEAAEREGVNTYTSFDDAFQSAVDEGLIGGKSKLGYTSHSDTAQEQHAQLALRQKAALAKPPAQRTAEDRNILNARSPDLMGAAMDDFGADLALNAAVKKRARQVVRQARRG